MYQRAWNYAEDHGIESETNYPYTAKDGTCAYSSSKGLVQTSDTMPYVDI